MARISRLLAGVGGAALAAVRLRRPTKGEARADPPSGTDDLATLSQAFTAEAPSLAEERYRTPADQVINYSIFMIDRQGRHATWNKVVGRMLGYAMPEFLGKAAAELYTP